MQTGIAGTAVALAALWCAAGPGGATAAGLAIVEEGRARATIVIAEQAGRKAKVAADDLQAYVEKMSGAKLPIAIDAKTLEGTLILVGKSRLTDQAGASVPSGLTAARREEGFILSCDGRRLVLAGNDEGPYHGTEYAVYDLLQRLGVRWFMPGDYGEYVPTKATIAVPVLQVTGKPDFVMRNWWGTRAEILEQENRWKIRNKLNPDVMFATPGDSTARSILPEARYFKEHPEWFAMNPDGTRNPYLPSLTHPKAVEAAAGIIKEHFRRNPDANSYGFAPDDGLPRDYSPDTLKLHQGFTELAGRPGVPAEASVTAEWLHFVNNVTAEVRRELPDKYIATNGYANRDIPPQGLRLDDHLIIMYANISACTIHGFRDARCWQKERMGQIMKRWCDLCPNTWLYGYNEQMMVSAYTPLPEVHKLRRDIPAAKRWGLLGFYDESRPVWAECCIQSRYLRARLEWDAGADVDAIVDDYFRHWYGKAVGPMKAFYDALEEALQQSPIHGHEDRFLPWVYTPALVKTLSARIAQGTKLADTPRVRLHVQADSLILDHLKAYLAMTAAEMAGDFAGAARQAERMLALRQQLHEINPFYMPSREKVPYSYWETNDRRDYYRLLAEKSGGKEGDLVALLPEEALFTTDTYDDGLFAEWYRPGTATKGWHRLLTTKPFFIQDARYLTARGIPYVGYLWYRLRVAVPATAAGRRVMLYVPTVACEAWAWVNGRFVGHRRHRDAYERPLEMEVDVTDALRPGETNEVVFRVSTGSAPAQGAEGLVSRAFLYAPKP